jgi:hypothetical protein
MNGWMGALFYMLEAKVVWSRAGDAMTTWRLHAPYWATAPAPEVFVPTLAARPAKRVGRSKAARYTATPDQP